MRLHILCSLSLSILLLADLAKPQTNNGHTTIATNETQSSPVPIPEPEPQPEPEPEPEPEPQPESKPEPVPATKSEAKLEKPTNQAVQSTKKPASVVVSVKKQQPSPKENSSLYTISEDPFNPENEEEDYGDKAESTNPDVIDEEAIQQLVNKFLNTGEGGEDGSERINKHAFALINSSSYWDLQTAPERSIKNPAEAKKWLDGYETEAWKVLHEVATAGWNYFTSISPINKQMLDEAEEMLSQFVKSTSKQARQFDLTKIEDPILRRQIELLTIEGINALNKTEYQQFTNIQSTINKAIADASICEQGKPKPCLLKSADLTSSIVYEKRPDTILYIWKTWRDAVKKADLASKYEQLMELTNKGAQMTGFKDAGAMWRSPFDLGTELVKPKIKLMEEINGIYEQILPFYKQLHSYFRRQLAIVYRPINSTTFSKDGPIPDHLFKNLMDYDWSKNFHETRPFKQDNKYSEAILDNLMMRNVTSKKLFIQAYKFFKSLSFDKLPAAFWQDSVFARKWTREILCDPPTAYDMRDRNHYRIKACAQVGEEGFKLAHKLFAQLYYQHAYRQQPLLFQEAANPSFLSALTGAFYIIAGNPEYLAYLNLAPTDGSNDQARQINSLYYEALTDFVKLPYDIVADTWRFNIFEGKTNKTNWNDDWWRLREYYQGIQAPIKREANDFDAITSAAIARIHSPATRHFIGYVMQFQILKALCPHQTELHKGCFLKESDVKNVKKVMSLGSSITWMEALEMITGSDKLDAKPLLEYYNLLITWLENTNEIDQALIGWDGPGTPFTEAELPAVNNSIESERNILGTDQVAYPGENCTSAQECLLDSTCKNGVCECNEGLYTLKIGNTHNCVPGNPADAGFGDSQGGLVIGLYPKENSSTPTSPAEYTVVPTPEPTTQIAAKSSERLSVSYLILALALSGLYLFLVNRR